MAYEFDKDKLKEYLSLDPEDESLRRVREQIFSVLDAEKVIDAQRKDTVYLAGIMDDIEVLKEEFDITVHSVTAAENAYSEALYIMYRMARRMHPFSEYGREMLSRATALRKEYEELFGPMITGIGRENADAFPDLIDDDMEEDVANGKLRGFALIRTTEGGIYPAGAVLYRMINIPEEGVEPVLDIKWFYVLPEKRGRRYSDLLMGEIAALALRKGAGAVTFSVPVDESYEVFLQLFSEWRFDAAPGVNSECVFECGDAKPPRGAAQTVMPLSVIPAGQRLTFIGMILRYMEEDGLLGSYLSKKPGYYDADISCFTGSPERPTGLLLAHVKPSGTVEPEYYGSVSEADNVTGELLAAFMDLTKKKYGDEAVALILPDSEETEDILDELIPEQPVFPTVEAVLVTKGAPDITKEDVEELVIAG